MFILSKKIYFSIVDNLRTIVNGTFSERNIKMLLVDVRELAKYFQTQVNDKSPNKNSDAIRAAVDCADFIFHSHRDRGYLAKSGNNIYKQIQNNIKEGEIKPINNVLSVDSIVVGLLGIVTLYLDKYSTSFTKEEMAKIFTKSKDEIALCILCLLQDSIILEKDGSNSGVLYLYAYEGKLRIYYRRFADLKFLGVKSIEHPVMIAFPVMISQIEHNFDVLFRDDLTVTDLFETYRSPSGSLSLRNVKRCFSLNGQPLLRFKNSVLEIYEAIKGETFTETEIKELILDLREFAIVLNSEVIMKPNENISLKGYLKSFLEVAAILAHQNKKDEGLIATNINKHLSILEKSMEENNSVPPNSLNVDNVIHSYSIIMGMLIVMEQYFKEYNKEYSLNELTKSIDDMSLCVISLLHEYSMNVYVDNSKAVFHVHSYENKFHLYCRIFGSSLEKYFPKKNDDKPFVIGFPVIMTNSHNKDNMIIEETRAEQKCIQTYRDSSGVLRVRFREA